MRSSIFLIYVVAICNMPAPVMGQQITRRHAFKAFDTAPNIALSADGKTLAAAARGVDTKTWKRWTDFGIWDVPSYEKRGSFKIDVDEYHVLALSPDGGLLVASSFNGKSRLWSIKDDRERNFVNIKGSSPIFAFSADGKRLAGISSTTILNTNKHGENPEWIPIRGRYAPSAFHPDLRTVAMAFHQDVDLIDTATGKLIGVLPDHPGSVNFIAFSADGHTAAVIVSEFDENGYDSEIVVWDIEKRAERARLRDLGYCRSLCVANDAKFVVVVADQELQRGIYDLKAVNVATGKVTSSYRFARGQSPQSYAFGGDGTLAAIGCSDGWVQLFNIK